MAEFNQRDPSTLAALQPLGGHELHVRDYLNRLRLQGTHYMLLKRPSRLPDSSRDYMSGDPVNLIDWKAFARTDQLIIREVRDEASAVTLIGVDLSRSMFWPLPESAPWNLPTKAEIAMRIALHLSYLHLRMGDQVLIQWTTAEDAKVPEYETWLKRPAVVQATYEQLASHGFDLKHWFVGERSRSLTQRRPAISYWLGDALGHADYMAFLGRARRHFLLHVLSSLELDSSWFDDRTSYFDESRGVKEYQGDLLKLRQQYNEQIRTWQQRLNKMQLQGGGSYLALSDRTKLHHYEAALQDFVRVVPEP